MRIRTIVSSADEPLGTICFVLGSTGMRIGEVLALRIEDVDFQHGLIHIRHSVFAGTLGTPKSEASMAAAEQEIDRRKRDDEMYQTAQQLVEPGFILQEPQNEEAVSAVPLKPALVAASGKATFRKRLRRNLARDSIG